MSKRSNPEKQTLKREQLQIKLQEKLAKEKQELFQKIEEEASLKKAKLLAARKEEDLKRLDSLVCARFLIHVAEPNAQRSLPKSLWIYSNKNIPRTLLSAKGTQ